MHSNVARGGGGAHWPEENAKYYVFSTFEADFCTKNKNSSLPLALAMRIGQEPEVISTRKTGFQPGWRPFFFFLEIT